MLLKFNLYDLYILSFIQLSLVDRARAEPGARHRHPLPLDGLEDHRGPRRRRGGGSDLGHRLRAHPRAVGHADRRPRDGRLPARDHLGRRDGPPAGPQRRRPGLLRLVRLGGLHLHRLRGLHRRRRHALDPRDADGFPGDPARSGRVRRVDLEHQLRERRLVPRTPGAAAAQGRSQLSADGVAAHPGVQRASRAADRDDQGGRADRLPELRGGRHRQQHQGSGRVGSGGGVLPGS